MEVELIRIHRLPLVPARTTLGDTRCGIRGDALDFNGRWLAARGHLISDIALIGEL